MDIYCKRRFYETLSPGLASVAESQWDHELLQNALMASPARHPFWHYVVAELIARSTMHNFKDVLVSTLEMTGPRLINAIFEIIPTNFMISMPRALFSLGPPRFFNISATNASLTFSPPLSEDIYSVHLETGVWK